MVPVISNDIFRINENVTSSTFSGSQPVGNVSVSSSKHSFPSDRNVTSISSSSRTVGIEDIMFVQVGESHKIKALTERVDRMEKHLPGLTAHIALLQAENNRLNEEIRKLEDLYLKAISNCNNFFDELNTINEKKRERKRKGEHSDELSSRKILPIANRSLPSQYDFPQLKKPNVT